MSDLDSIVSVSIEVKDRAPTRASFGKPMFVDYHQAWIDYARDYAEADELLDDGFTTTSPAYNWALAVKSQQPAVELFKIGRLSTPYTQTVTFTPDPAAIVQGYELHAVAAGTAVDYTVGAAPTAASICAATNPLFDALASVVATTDTAKVTCAANAPGVFNTYSWARGWNVADITADPGIVADLNNIADEDDDWYGLNLAVNSKAIVSAVAPWIEARAKELIYMTGDADVLNAGITTDIASTLKAASYARTGGVWHRYIGGEWINGAWTSVMLADDPGAATPAFKPLAGITEDDLRTAEANAILAKNCSWYDAKHEQSITYEGKAASGRFLDVTRFVDWLKENIQVDIFAYLVNNKKVAFTQRGLDAIGMIIEGVLVRGGVAGGIDLEQAYSATPPRLADVPTGDKAIRRARGFKFKCVLSGALHGVTIEGTVSV